MDKIIWKEVNRKLLPDIIEIVWKVKKWSHVFSHVNEIYEVTETAKIDGVKHYRTRIIHGEPFYNNDLFANSLIEWAKIGEVATQNIHRIIKKIKSKRDKNVNTR